MGSKCPIVKIFTKKSYLMTNYVERYTYRYAGILPGTTSKPITNRISLGLRMPVVGCLDSPNIGTASPSTGSDVHSAQA
jgi:hypothetical protein